MNVLSMGNMLVEIVRPGLDMPLDRPAAFQGPFPSGDTIIYIAQVARSAAARGRWPPALRLHRRGRCGRIWRIAVAPAACGWRGLLADSHPAAAQHWRRLQRALQRWQPPLPSFTGRHSAAGQLSPDYVDADLLSNVSWLHLSGCNLAICDSARDACYRAMDCLPPGARLKL